MVTVYHGSSVIVECPEIREANKKTDFGKGFYVTSSFDQAVQWAEKKMAKLNISVGYVSIYEFDYEHIKKNFITQEFLQADEKWLRFVVNNRDKDKDYPVTTDVDYGPVADDTVYQVLGMFEKNIYTFEETISRLKTATLHDQFCIHSTDVLKFCKFVGFKEIVKKE